MLKLCIFRTKFVIALRLHGDCIVEAYSYRSIWGDVGYVLVVT